MAWMFEEGVKTLGQGFKAALTAGLEIREAVVLLAFMGDLQEVAGEVTTARPVSEIRSLTGLSYDQIQRALKKLRDAGLISRKQLVKRAGEAALTTVLPKAFAALGLPDPSGRSGLQSTITGELAELLCGQPWSVVEAVSTAWESRTLLDQDVERAIRGPLTRERVSRVLYQRYEEAMQELEQAVVEVEAVEAIRATGLDVVQTADGPVTVNVRKFETLSPVAVPWEFVRDVLLTLHSRDPGLVTFANLRDRIAEAAYARVALPFVKDKGWSDAVKLLARQMEIHWRKPNRIWPSWYSAAEAVIHTPALGA